MKRGAPLQRRTPLRNTPKTHATHAQKLSAFRERPPVPPLDFSAAANAFRHAREAAATPHVFDGPVPDPVKAVRPAGDGSFTPPTRTLILARDRNTCQMCGRAPGDSWPGISLQHRAARQQGGTTRPHIAAASNGIALCGSGTTGCHGWVESNGTLAEAIGFAVASWADPLTVPVLTFAGWRLLDDTGHSIVASAPPAGGDAHTRAHRVEARGV